MIKIIKELVFPRRCPVCDRVVHFGKYICTGCKEKLVKIKGNKCYKCGKKLISSDEEYCYDCSKTKHIYDRGFSLYEYNSICKSIYKFKYSKRAEYGDYYGAELAKAYKKVIAGWNVDAIIPVPLHRKKYNQRGYNQALLLASSMSKYLKIPCLPQYVTRKINTVPMKKLNSKERQINLKNAFNICTDDVKLSRVIIVDDIYTTGSTIDEIARVLKENGVEKVYFITLSAGAGL